MGPDSWLGQPVQCLLVDCAVPTACMEFRYGTRTFGRGTASHCLTADCAVPAACMELGMGLDSWLGQPVQCLLVDCAVPTACMEFGMGLGHLAGAPRVIASRQTARCLWQNAGNWMLVRARLKDGFCPALNLPGAPWSPRIRELALGWDIVGFPNFVDLLRVERSRNNNPTLSFHTFGSCMARWAGDRAVGVLIRNVEAHEWYLISVGWQACCCRKRIVAPQALCMGSAGIFHCLWASLWVPVLNTVRVEFRYFRWVSFSSRVPSGARGGACFHAGVPCVRTFGAAKGQGSWLCSRMRIVGRAEWESP